MKKLAIFFTIVLLSLGIADAVMLTQRLGSEEVKMTVNANEIVTLKFKSKDGFQFKNWTVKSGTLGGVNLNSDTISFSMPNQNITIRGNYDSQYTITYHANGGQGSMIAQGIIAGKTVNLSKNMFKKTGYVFEGWATSAGESAMYTNEESIKPTGNMNLYAVWAAQPRLADVVEVGDYVSYTPVAKTIDLSSLTGFTQSNLNTANTTEWRVLSVDEDTGIVEIVSADTVGTLKLTQESWGTLENADMKQAQSNYANAVYILNEISRQYATGVGTGRGLGYNGNVTNIEKLETEATHEYVLANSSTLLGVDPYDDTEFRANFGAKDISVLKEQNMMHTTMHGDYVWLTSRDMVTDSDCAYFFIRYVDTVGNAPYIHTFRELADGTGDTGTLTNGIRPVVSLDTDIVYEKIGTDGDSWRIVHSGGSGGTVTYKNIRYHANDGDGVGKMTSQVNKTGATETLRMNAFTRRGYTFEGWATSADGDVVYTDGQTVTLNADLDLYAVWKAEVPAVRFAEVAEVGDYVNYTPVAKTIDLGSLTGIAQTSLNAKDMTEWRVLSVNKDTGVVELVSAASIGVILLSQDDSGTAETARLTAARNNYANLISILNEISEGYATGVGTGRGLGWSGTSSEEITTDITHEYVKANLSALQNVDPYNDTYYKTNGSKVADVVVMNANEGMIDGTVTWLACRTFTFATTYTEFGARYISTDGTIHGNALYREDESGNMTSYSRGSRGVRPVVSLKSDINYSEVGTSGNSWEIIH